MKKRKIFGMLGVLGSLTVIPALTSCSEKKETVDQVEVNVANADLTKSKYGISLANNTINTIEPNWLFESNNTGSDVIVESATDFGITLSDTPTLNEEAGNIDARGMTFIFEEGITQPYGDVNIIIPNFKVYDITKPVDICVTQPFSSYISTINGKASTDYMDFSIYHFEAGEITSGSLVLQVEVEPDSKFGFLQFGNTATYDEDMGEYTNLTYTLEVDSISPDFETTDYYYPVNVNNPVSLNTILSSIHATDETDGDVSGNVKLESTTYDPNNLSLGTHEFNVSVSDNSGNITYATYYITVYDLDKPTISGTDSYSVSYDTNLTMDMIKKNLEVGDNFSEDLSLNIVNDTFTGNENKVGNYAVAFNTTDEAGNTSYTYTVNIEIYDKKAPIITCPGSIEINNLAEYTIEELQSKISVTDGYDGGLTTYSILGFNNYLKNSTKGGTYVITIKATDSNNNAATATINLIVSDKVAPYTWFYSGTFIQIQKGETLTKDMIISYLTQIGEITPEEVVNISLEESEETGVVAVSIVKTDGSVYKTVVSTVEYNEDGTIKTDKAEVQKPNWWNNMWNSISKFFKGFGDFFVKLFTGKLWTKEVENDETIVNVNTKTVNDEAHYNSDGIIDNQFVVYELDVVDPGNEPAVIPELDLDNTPTV